MKSTGYGHKVVLREIVSSELNWFYTPFSNIITRRQLTFYLAKDKLVDDFSQECVLQLSSEGNQTALGSELEPFGVACKSSQSLVHELEWDLLLELSLKNTPGSFRSGMTDCEMDRCGV